MRRLTIAAVAVVALVTGCGPTPDAAPDSTTVLNRDEAIRVYPLTLPDGRTVMCALFTGYKKGGLSCDWASAQ